MLSNTNACHENNSMHKLRILILYPDPAGLGLLTSMLKSLGHIIEEATNDRVAVKLMERNNIDLVLAGVDPLETEALELLTYVRRKHREVPVILLFPRLHPERAKERCGWGRWPSSSTPFRGRTACRGAASLELCEARERRAGFALRPHQPQHSLDPATAPGSAPPGDGRFRTRRPLRVRGPSSPPTPCRSSVRSGSRVPASTRREPQRVELLAREIGLIGTDPSWRQVIDLAATIARDPHFGLDRR